MTSGGHSDSTRRTGPTRHQSTWRTRPGANVGGAHPGHLVAGLRHRALGDPQGRPSLSSRSRRRFPASDRPADSRWWSRIAPVPAPASSQATEGVPPRRARSPAWAPSRRHSAPTARNSISTIDRTKVESLGVSLNDVFRTFEAYLAPLVNLFDKFNQGFQVESRPSGPRRCLDDIKNLYVANR